MPTFHHHQYQSHLFNYFFCSDKFIPTFILFLHKSLLWNKLLPCDYRLWNPEEMSPGPKQGYEWHPKTDRCSTKNNFKKERTRWVNFSVNLSKYQKFKKMTQEKWSDFEKLVKIFYLNFLNSTRVISLPFLLFAYLRYNSDMQSYHYYKSSRKCEIIR